MVRPAFRRKLIADERGRVLGIVNAPNRGDQLETDPVNARATPEDRKTAITYDKKRRELAEFMEERHDPQIPCGCPEGMVHNMAGVYNQHICCPERSKMGGDLDYMEIPGWKSVDERPLTGVSLRDIEAVQFIQDGIKLGLVKVEPQASSNKLKATAVCDGSSPLRDLKNYKLDILPDSWKRAVNLSNKIHERVEYVINSPHSWGQTPKVGIHAIIDRDIAKTGIHSKVDDLTYPKYHLFDKKVFGPEAKLAGKAEPTGKKRRPPKVPIASEIEEKGVDQVFYEIIRNNPGWEAEKQRMLVALHHPEVASSGYDTVFQPTPTGRGPNYDRYVDPLNALEGPEASTPTFPSLNVKDTALAAPKRRPQKRRRDAIREAWLNRINSDDAPPIWPVEKLSKYQQLAFPRGTDYGMVADELMLGNSRGRSLYDDLTIYSWIVETILDETKGVTLTNNKPSNKPSGGLVNGYFADWIKNTNEYVQIRNTVNKKYVNATQGSLDASILYTPRFGCLSIEEKKIWTQCLNLGRILQIEQQVACTTDDMIEFMYPADDSFEEIMTKYVEGEKTLPASFVEDDARI